MKTIILTGCVMALASSSAWSAPIFVKAERANTDTARSEFVSFADLNMSGEAGLRTLKGRIHAAANRVCVSDIPEPLQANLESNSCYRRAVGESLARVERILAARDAGTAIAAATVSVSAGR